jgi:hypothetical protein
MQDLDGGARLEVGVQGCLDGGRRRASGAVVAREDPAEAFISTTGLPTARPSAGGPQAGPCTDNRYCAASGRQCRPHRPHKWALSAAPSGRRRSRRRAASQRPLVPVLCSLPTCCRASVMQVDPESTDVLLVGRFRMHHPPGADAAMEPALARMEPVSGRGLLQQPLALTANSAAQHSEMTLALVGNGADPALTGASLGATDVEERDVLYGTALSSGALQPFGHPHRAEWELDASKVHLGRYGGVPLPGALHGSPSIWVDLGQEPGARLRC